MVQSVPSPAPSRPGAEVRETHLSWVLLVGDLALKILKPRQTAFVDQRTVDQRAAACRREVELNRRLAPDVYLGTSPVTTETGVVEHVVVMRRLPSGSALSALVGTPAMLPAVTAVARRLAAFHAGLEPDPDATEVASATALGDLWNRSLDEVAVDRAGPNGDGVQVPVERIRHLATGWLAGRAPLLDQRIAEGRVVDGHGDLLADDVFVLPDGPRLLDCLAFDDRLRRGDVLADVAFLAMDLERLAGPSVAAALVADYQEFSGEQHPASLHHHFVAYRALVRAKVALLRCGSGDDPGAARLARTFTSMCLDHLERGRVGLTLVGGGPGTGKTTLAHALAAARADGTVVLSSDVVRRELWPDGGPGGPSRPDPGHRLDEGQYAPEVTARTYAELLRRAEQLLGRGVPVVIDAAWPDPAGRAAARAVAATTHSELTELCCSADRVTAAARVRRRNHAPGEHPDVDPLLVGPLTARRAPWPEACPVRATTVAEAVEVASRAMAAAGRAA